MDNIPIEDHGIIGNLETVALIGRDGTIDWCCFPHVESSSLFARLLDTKHGGHFTVQPAAPFEAAHEYIDRTNVLQTQFRTASGQATVTDFMPVPDVAETDQVLQQAIFRKLTCEGGPSTYRSSLNHDSTMHEQSLLLNRRTTASSRPVTARPFLSRDRFHCSSRITPLLPR